MTSFWIAITGSRITNVYMSRSSAESSDSHPATFVPAKLKDAYWRVVTDCLVEFHGLPRIEAHRRVRELRARVESPPVDPQMAEIYAPELADLFYNTEPFYVAEDIAGQQLDEEKYRPQYQAIRRRHDHEQASQT
jgi:hypothetical protein